MQPKPMAETSRPLLPSLRLCIHALRRGQRRLDLPGLSYGLKPPPASRRFASGFTGSVLAFAAAAAFSWRGVGRGWMSVRSIASSSLFSFFSCMDGIVVGIPLPAVAFGVGHDFAGGVVLDRANLVVRARGHSRSPCARSFGKVYAGIRPFRHPSALRIRRSGAADAHGVMARTAAFRRTPCRNRPKPPCSPRPARRSRLRTSSSPICAATKCSCAWSRRACATPISASGPAACRSRCPACWGTRAPVSSSRSAGTSRASNPATKWC